MLRESENKVRQAMEDVFGDDKRRISHALRVTGYAAELLKKEMGDREIVLCAALLHDVGISVAAKKYGSSSGHYQEKEGPPLARKILKILGYDSGMIEEICGIVGNHHSPGKINSMNFKILYDADWLVNLPDETKGDKKKLERMIDKVFITQTGKELAKDIYLRDGKGIIAVDMK
ncbi:MAG: HD domain-containing protein [Candidatus Omnitrophica bacterium]|nr:HD domain-containing protein [Candidatus Omnitrophota bacterium]